MAGPIAARRSGVPLRKTRNRSVPPRSPAAVFHPTPVIS
jgi:hypothetical protein